VAQHQLGLGVGVVAAHADVDLVEQAAVRFYGDAELYRPISTASGIADPAVIDVGQRLIIPDITRYTLVAGDTLSALASPFYGDASFYPR
jgi:nucleoid-associated protein YgaU